VNVAYSYKLSMLLPIGQDVARHWLYLAKRDIGSQRRFCLQVRAPDSKDLTIADNNLAAFNIGIQPPFDQLDSSTEVSKHLAQTPLYLSQM